MDPIGVAAGVSGEWIKMRLDWNRLMMKRSNVLINVL